MSWWQLILTQSITSWQNAESCLELLKNSMTWANEFLARMCDPELSKDLHEASTIYSRHGLLHDEMIERGNDFARFEDFGRELIDNGHYMSQDIQEKASSVSHRKKTLMELWTLRNSLYEQHIDYLKWLKEIKDIESWLGEKEPEVTSSEYGNNFDDLDKLMIKQLEMEEALLNKEEKINQIKRITLIESEFKALKAKEEEARREDEQRQETERLEAIKKKEMARRTREKKREDERRRTQEIVLPPSHALNKEVTKAENDIPRFNTRRSLRQGPTIDGKWTLLICHRSQWKVFLSESSKVTRAEKGRPSDHGKTTIPSSVANSFVSSKTKGTSKIGRLLRLHSFYTTLLVKRHLTTPRRNTSSDW